MNSVELTPAEDLSPAAVEARPKTGVIVALLAGAAIIISYLFAYGLMNALMAADLVARWQPGHDPRPKFFLVGFVALLGTFSVVGFIARSMSRRQMSKIDAMESD